MKAIINTKLILEDGIIFDGVIIWKDGRILQLGSAGDVSVPADAEIIDARGLYTAPGLVDIHNHGSKQYLFSDEPTKCAEHFLSHGETTVLPTFYMTLSRDAMLAGAAVSFAGLLGFVGLVAPHMTRMLCKNEAHLQLPIAALFGAALCLVCDLIARTAFAPYELPVGVVLSFLGAPFFLYLLLIRKKRSRHDES